MNGEGAGHAVYLGLPSAQQTQTTFNISLHALTGKIFILMWFLLLAATGFIPTHA